MVDYQFVDELPDTLRRGGDLGIARLCQNDRLDAEDLGGRTGQSAAIEVGADAVEVPLLQEQALLPQGLDADRSNLGGQYLFGGVGHRRFCFPLYFRRHAGTLQLHDAAGGGRTWLVGRLYYRYQQRQPSLDDFPAVAEIPANLHGMVFQLDKFLKIRNLGDA